MGDPTLPARVLPPALAALVGVVLAVGLVVLGLGLAYAYGAPGLVALAVGCGVALAAGVVAVRRRRSVSGAARGLRDI